MPAAAVIPAPIAYIKVVAVETLVVELLSVTAGAHSVRCWLICDILRQDGAVLNWAVPHLRTVTLNKLECLRQTFDLNTLAWNNEDGLRSFFVGSRTRVTINRDSWAAAICSSAVGRDRSCEYRQRRAIPHRSLLD